MRMRTTVIVGILFAVILCALPRPVAASGPCDNITQFLAGKALRVVCFHSADLRTNTTAITDNTTQPPTGPTTPPDNSITTFADGTTLLPGSTALGSNFSFTPITDRGVISNNAPPTSGPAVPGIQVEGWFAHDPSGEARFLLRFPDTWNGKLVVAGASGTRSEFNGDFAWSDYALSKGYAYASQNKGVLNLYFASLASVPQPATDPLSCRLNPFSSSTLWVHFYDNDPQKPFTQWTQYMILTTLLAQEAVKANYHHHPSRTYAVGTSNGGYQVRRALEEAPELYDGGVDWEGTFVDPRGPNILIDLPPAIKNFPGYVAGGCKADGPESTAIQAAGYPPDIVTTCITTASATNGTFGTLWGHYSAQFWEVTACQWQKRFDPAFDTYGDLTVKQTGNLPTYDYLSRIHTVPGVFRSVDKVETTGDIGKPLITVAGTMDALLPIKRGARAYEARVLASRRHHHDDDDDDDDRDHDRDEHHGHHHPAYRLYEVQNGNHIESYIPLFSGQLELVQPHALKAFDLLVNYVEHHEKLPPSQCIPKGGSIAQHPSEPGHCAQLLAP